MLRPFFAALRWGPCSSRRWTRRSIRPQPAPRSMRVTMLFSARSMCRSAYNSVVPKVNSASQKLDRIDAEQHRLRVRILKAMGTTANPSQSSAGNLHTTDWRR